MPAAHACTTHGSALLDATACDGLNGQQQCSQPAARMLPPATMLWSGRWCDCLAAAAIAPKQEAPHRLGLYRAKRRAAAGTRGRSRRCAASERSRWSNHGFARMQKAAAARGQAQTRRGRAVATPKGPAAPRLHCHDNLWLRIRPIQGKGGAETARFISQHESMSRPRPPQGPAPGCWRPPWRAERTTRPPRAAGA